MFESDEISNLMEANPSNEADLFSIEAPATYIKQENFSEYPPVEPLVEVYEAANGAGKSSSKATESMYCALCMRQCASSLIICFPSDTNVLEHQQLKLQDAVGIWLTLEHCEICRTCWKLVELVADFKECCSKAASWFDQFPSGVEAVDDWLSSKTLRLLEGTQGDLRKHIDSMEQEMTEAVEEMEDIVPVTTSTRQRKFKGKKEEDFVVTDDDVSEESSDSSHSEALEESDDSYSDEEVVTKPKKARKGGRKASSVADPVVLEKDHYKAEIFNCEKCERKFDGYRALHNHGRYCNGKTDDREWFTCSLCSASFNESYALGFHMNKHKGVKPFKCRKHCNNTFYSNFTRIKHEKNYCEPAEGRICPICGAHLKNDGSLRRHNETVHGTGEGKYPCKICGQKFRIPNLRYRHMRVHSDERKYPCKFCDKTFKNLHSAKVHMRVHTNEKPFACHLCGQAFMHKCTLKAHIERHN